MGRWEYKKIERFKTEKNDQNTKICQIGREHKWHAKIRQADEDGNTRIGKKYLEDI